MRLENYRKNEDPAAGGKTRSEGHGRARPDHCLGYSQNMQSILKCQ